MKAAFQVGKAELGAEPRQGEGDLPCRARQGAIKKGKFSDPPKGNLGLQAGWFPSRISWIVSDQEASALGGHLQAHKAPPAHDFFQDLHFW